MSSETSLLFSQDLMCGKMSNINVTFKTEDLVLYYKCHHNTRCYILATLNDFGYTDCMLSKKKTGNAQDRLDRKFYIFEPYSKDFGDINKG